VTTSRKRMVKMKERTKGFVSGIIVMAMIVALPGYALAAYQKTATLDYAGIKITLNGNTITPTDANGSVVEPFAIDGTTYLPVRAVAGALGLGVEWDGQTKTVILSRPFNGSDLSTVQLLGFYKILQESFSDLETNFTSIIDGYAKSLARELISSGPYKGMTFSEAVQSKLAESLSLVDGHYELCRDYLQDSDMALVFEYRRLNSLASSAFSALDSGSSTEIQTAKESTGQAILSRMEAGSKFWDVYQSAEIFV
jgi:hypothetical protein